MTASLARLIRSTSDFGSLVWISPGNPSSQKWFEALPAARKVWVPWGPEQPLPARALGRGTARTLFLWNPMVHGTCPAALRAVHHEMRPGDRLGMLFIEPTRVTDAWRYELKQNGFESLRTTPLGQSPFLKGHKLSFELFRPKIAWISKPSLSLVVPVRNEADKVPQLLARLTGLAHVETEILFVEGHSRDDTWGAIGRTIENYRGPFRLRTLRQPGEGKADAVQWGLSRAEAKVFGVLDGDLSTPPEAFRRFYEALVAGDGDLIYGDRFRLPVDLGLVGLVQKVGQKLLASAVGRIIRQPVGDVLCGTKVISAEDYRALLKWSALNGRSAPVGDLDWIVGAGALNLKLFGIPVTHKGPWDFSLPTMLSAILRAAISVPAVAHRPSASK